MWPNVCTKEHMEEAEGSGHGAWERRDAERGDAKKNGANGETRGLEKWGTQGTWAGPVCIAFDQYMLCVLLFFSALEPLLLPWLYVLFVLKSSL